jgi:hypothetical protein
MHTPDKTASKSFPAGQFKQGHIANGSRPGSPHFASQQNRLLQLIFAGTVIASLIGAVLGVDRPVQKQRAGLLLLEWGDYIAPIRDLSPTERREFEGLLDGTPRVGFHYQYVSVWFLSVWTWGGEPVLYQGTRYWPNAGDAKIFANVSTPWTYQFPPGLALLVIWILVGLVVSGRSDESRVRKLMADEHYATALKLYVDAKHTTIDPERGYDPARFKIAKAYLLDQNGIDPEVAHRNLEFLTRWIQKQAETREETPTKN